jgi:hypothetical protein
MDDNTSAADASFRTYPKTPLRIAVRKSSGLSSIAIKIDRILRPTPLPVSFDLYSSKTDRSESHTSKFTSDSLISPRMMPSVWFQIVTANSVFLARMRTTGSRSSRLPQRTKIRGWASTIGAKSPIGFDGAGAMSAAAYSILPR